MWSSMSSSNDGKAESWAEERPSRRVQALTGFGDSAPGWSRDNWDDSRLDRRYRRYRYDSTPGEGPSHSAARPGRYDLMAPNVGAPVFTYLPAGIM